MSIDGTNPTPVTIHAYLEEDGRALVVVQARDTVKDIALSLSFSTADARKIAQQLLDAAVLVECQSFLAIFGRTRLDMTVEQSRQFQMAFRIALEKAGITSGGMGSGELHAATEG